LLIVNLDRLKNHKLNGFTLKIIHKMKMYAKHSPISKPISSINSTHKMQVDPICVIFLIERKDFARCGQNSKLMQNEVILHLAI